MIERTENPALAIHLEVAGSPDDRVSDIAREDGILCGKFADRSDNELRVNREVPCLPAARASNSFRVSV